MNLPDLPQQLLDLASEPLVSNNPSEAKIRRSVSSCYYAIFHFTTQAAVNSAIPDPRLANVAIRSIPHKRFRDALYSWRDRYPYLADIRTLYDKRQTADYDLTFSMQETELQVALQVAYRMMSDLEMMKSVPADWTTLAGQLLFPNSNG